MDCAAALERIREGRPLTVKDDAGNTTKCVADIVSVGTLTALLAIWPLAYMYVLCDRLSQC